MTTTASRRGRLWFRMIVVATPVLVGLALSAWLLTKRGVIQRDENGQIRWVRPPLYLEEPGHERTGHRYLYDDVLGWRNIPDWQATTNGKPLTINSLGLRDSEHTYEKSAGVKRVLVLGDSYVWGYGVGDDETFCARLENRYSERNEQIEVINTGVSGWGTDQELLYLREEGYKYQPDVVVVAFFIGNDVDNNVAARQYELNKPVFVDGTLTLGNVPVPRPRKTQTSRTVLLRLNELDPVRHTVEILKGISRECAKLNCELVLMKFGIFLAPDLRYARDLDDSFAIALDKAKLDLHYLDLDKRFKELRIDASVLTAGNDDGHWNALGHGKVAAELDAFLSTLEVLSQ